MKEKVIMSNTYRITRKNNNNLTLSKKYKLTNIFYKLNKNITKTHDCAKLHEKKTIVRRAVSCLCLYIQYLFTLQI